MKQSSKQSDKQSDEHESPECSTHGSAFSIMTAVDPMGKSFRCRWTGEELREGRRVSLKCSWRVRLHLGVQERGFLNGKTSNAIFVSKIKVLRAVQELEGVAIISAIVEKSGLSLGQVQGVLHRSLKYDFVARSEERTALVPQGSAFLWGLSERGEQFLTWSESWDWKGESDA